MFYRPIPGDDRECHQSDHNECHDRTQREDRTASSVIEAVRRCLVVKHVRSPFGHELLRGRPPQNKPTLCSRHTVKCGCSNGLTLGPTRWWVQTSGPGAQV